MPYIGKNGAYFIKLLLTTNAIVTAKTGSCMNVEESTLTRNDYEDMRNGIALQISYIYLAREVLVTDLNFCEGRHAQEIKAAINELDNNLKELSVQFKHYDSCLEAIDANL